MFWLIEQREEKRKPNDFDCYLKGRIFKKPVWKYHKPVSFSINGVEQTNIDYIGFVDGEPIPRGLKSKINIKLCKSTREGKKVRRKTIIFDSIRYWEVINFLFKVDGYFSSNYLDSVVDKIVSKKCISHDMQNSLISDLEKKINPAIESFKEDYRKSAEFFWFSDNVKLIREKKRKDQRTKEEAEEKAQQREQAEYLKNGFSTQPEKIITDTHETEKEIIKAGYKVLAMKYHPDKNGNHEDFIKLGKAKEKLLNQ